MPAKISEKMATIKPGAESSPHHATAVVQHHARTPNHDSAQPCRAQQRVGGQAVPALGTGEASTMQLGTTHCTLHGRVPKPGDGFGHSTSVLLKRTTAMPMLVLRRRHRPEGHGTLPLVVLLTTGLGGTEVLGRPVEGQGGTARNTDGQTLLTRACTIRKIRITTAVRPTPSAQSYERTPMSVRWHTVD